MAQPIFIHSLFRTGSSYLFSKFRERSDLFYCYYEPFHQSLRSLSEDSIEKSFQDQKLLRHGSVDRPYFDEFRDLIEKGGGVRHFKEEFILSDYYSVLDEADLSLYISALLENAKDKWPLLQFNRSSMRTGWFKNRYPESLNLYILRNPRDQWQSYEGLLKSGKPFFSAMDYLIASVAADGERFEEISRLVPVIRLKHLKFEKLIHTAYELVRYLSPKERYTLFYYIWKTAYDHNKVHADLLIDMDLLGDERGESLNRALFDFCTATLNFDDYNIKKYSSYDLDRTSFEEIEGKAEEVISGRGERKGESSEIRKGEIVQELVSELLRTRERVSELSLKKIVKRKLGRMTKGILGGGDDR